MKARSAAETVAGSEAQCATIEGKLTLLTWQIGTLVALQVTVGLPALWLLTRVAFKVGAVAG